MQREKLSALVVLTALVAVGLVGAALIVPTGADADDGSADRSITVNAAGDASAPPDRAVVRVAATAEGDEPREVRDALAERADALRSNLAEANVSEDDYETSRYRIREARRHPDDRDGPAYEGVHAFRVTLDDPERAAAVIDAAADADAEVGDVRFTLSEERRDELRETAIENAMDDARAQAEAIADSGGLRVTSVHTVDAAERDYRPVRHEAAAASAPDDAETTIDTGEASVTYRVEVTYNATLA
jgi:uncharacterized protein YggE